MQGLKGQDRNRTICTIQTVGRTEPVGTGEQNEAHTTVPAGLEHRKEKTG